jgi:hypothetical protein
MRRWLPIQILLIFTILACGQAAPALTPTSINRYALLPVEKHTPEQDAWPPIAAAGWSQPEPLPYPVNTAGGEDSPFILPDGQTLYYFFTPDVSIPAEKQILDGVTGIWVTQQTGEGWSEPVRIHLQDAGKLALDGCEFVMGERMYFCTTREGYTGIQWFSAERRDGLWQGWRYAGDELKQTEYQVGELHISADGQELYFHSARPGGLGGLDLWVSQMTSSGWGEPANLGPQVNTSGDEGWPYVSPDGNELWFNASSQAGKPGPAIYLSTREADGSWGKAREIISSFAGEPSLSGDGKTLYFVHHYFSADVSRMLEADIYFTRRP